MFRNDTSVLPKNAYAYFHAMLLYESCAQLPNDILKKVNTNVFAYSARIFKCKL